MAWIAIGTAVVGAVGGAVQGNANRKAAAGAAAAASSGGANAIDINKLITDARTNAAENYKNSLALERQYNPGQAALRDSTNAALSQLSSSNTPTARARDSLLGELGAPNSLLQQSADSILEQLSLGGSLSPETQNAVVRGALQRGGQAGIGGSEAARGLVARDLGLTSIGLLQQRQKDGLTAGTALSNDFLSRLGLAQNAMNSDAQRTGLLAAAVQGMPLPESGLSPGAIANAFIGQKNSDAQIGTDLAAINARSNSNTLNSVLGFGSTALQAYLNRPAAGSGGNVMGSSLGASIGAGV